MNCISTGWEGTNMKHSQFPGRGSLGSRTGAKGIVLPNAAPRNLDELGCASRRAQETHKRFWQNVEMMNRQAAEARRRVWPIRVRSRLPMCGSVLGSIVFMLIVAAWFLVGQIPSDGMSAWLDRHNVPASVSDAIDSTLSDAKKARAAAQAGIAALDRDGFNPSQIRAALQQFAVGLSQGQTACPNRQNR